MAIILNSSPFSCSTVYNDFWLGVSSLNAASNANFKFVFDIHTGSTATTRIFRSEVAPYPGTIAGYFNPNRVLEKYLNYDFNTVYGGTSCPNSIMQYWISIGEEYGLSAVTIYPGLYVVSGYTTNAVLQYEDLPSWNTTQPTYFFTGTGITNTHILTNKPLRSWIKDENKETIGFLNLNRNVPVNYIKLEVFNGATGLGTYYLSNGAATYVTNANLVNTYGIGPRDINQLSPSEVYIFLSTFLQPNLITQPLLTATSYTHYTIQPIHVTTYLSGDTEDAWFETRTYVRDYRCTKYEPVRLAFLNTHGQMDYYSFNLVSRTTINASQQKYKQLLGRNYSVGDRGYTVFDNIASKGKRVQSDYVNTLESEWLAQQMLMSKAVFEIQTVNNVDIKIPINITTSSNEIKKMINDKIMYYDFEFEYANKQNTQRA